MVLKTFHLKRISLTRLTNSSEKRPALGIFSVSVRLETKIPHTQTKDKILVSLRFSFDLKIF